MLSKADNGKAFKSRGGEEGFRKKNLKSQIPYENWFTHFILSESDNGKVFKTRGKGYRREGRKEFMGGRNFERKKYKRHK